MPNTSRYETLMKQRHINLLGRSINLSKLIAQRITSMLQKSLRASIEKFESGDLTGIVELDALIRINKLTHKLLSKHLLLEDFANGFAAVFWLWFCCWRTLSMGLLLIFQ